MKIIINKSALKIAILFYIIYWPVIIIGLLIGNAMTWGGGPQSIFDKIGWMIFRFFYLVPSVGFIINSIISTIITYLIALGIITFCNKKVKKIE